MTTTEGLSIKKLATNNQDSSKQIKNLNQSVLLPTMKKKQVELPSVIQSPQSSSNHFLSDFSKPEQKYSTENGNYRAEARRF